MKNSEIFKNILQQLEENHLNLYHSISKEEVCQYISQMPNLDNLKDYEFDKEMLKLFALFKDGHTQYYVPHKFLSEKFHFIDGKLYLDDELNEIVSIAGLPVKEIVKNIEKMISYETKEFLNDCLQQRLNNGYYYFMLGLLDEKFDLHCTVLADDKLEERIISSISIQQAKEKGVYKKEKPYSYKILDDVLYIDYNACREIEDYSFSEFVEDIKKEIEEKNITKYILDLRDNHGGNSEILNPFQQLVKEKGLQGALIINNGVFSSGRFAVARFKKEFNTLLVGEGTGGAAKSYGYNKNLSVDNKRFSVSIRLWDFSDIFGSEGSIQPDIYIPTTLNDIKNNKDSQLEMAINILKRNFSEKENDC